MEKHLLVFFYALFGGLLAHAQLNTTGLKKFSVEDGLSHNTVYSAYQDSKGYLWFGTRNGLNRYDGYQFEVFRHQFNTAHTIAGNTILDIVEDHEGGLWFGTNDGLSYYCKNSNTFTNFFTGKWDQREQKAYVKSLLIDQNGDLWVGNYSSISNSNWAGLLKFRVIKGEGTDQTKCSVRLEQLAEYEYSNVFDILQTRAGQIWLGTSEGAFILNSHTGKFEILRPLAPFLTPKRSSQDNGIRINTILEDSQGLIWLGGKGVFRFSAQDSSFDKVCPYTDCSLVNTLSQDHRNNIWVGNNRYGITLLSPEGKLIEKINFNQLWQGQQDNGISHIYKDQSNTLWIASRNYGLSRINALNRSFIHVKSNKLNSKSLNTLCINPDNHVILSLSSPSVYINPRDGKISSGTALHDRYRSPSLPAHSNNLILSRDQRFYFFTHTERDSTNLWHFEVETRQTKLLCRFKETRVRELYQDHQQNLWLTVTANGLWKFHLPTHTLTRFPPGLGSINIETTQCVLEDQQGNIWIGTRGGGLNKLDPQGTFSYYLPDSLDAHAFPGIIVNDLCLDQTGTLWIGTKTGGIARYNPQTDNFTTFSRQQGLASEYIAAIEVDHHNKIWCSTLNGISKLDPLTGKITNYDAQDGLQGSLFRFGVSGKDANSTLSS